MRWPALHFFTALGAMLLLSSQAASPDLPQDQGPAGGVGDFGSVGLEDRLREPMLTPVGPNLFQPIRFLEYGSWFWAQDGLLGEAGWSLPVSGALPIPAASAEGRGLHLGTLSIEAAPGKPDPSGIALTGELGLFSKSAQQPGTTERGDNRDWSRETSPEPADAMRGAVWVIPLVFLLIFWLLLGYERGGRRRRSSSRQTPAPQTPPRRSSRRRRH